MIKIEKAYKGKSFFNDDMSTSWDKEREKSFKISIFGLSLFKRTESLNIEYDVETKNKKVGFK